MAGEPGDFTNPGFGGQRFTYGIDVGVTYGKAADGWGIAMREPTTRKLLTPAGVALGERRGANLWYPYPHGVALVFLEAPDVAKSAARYPKVDIATASKGELEHLVRAKWSDYFTGAVAAPADRLKAGDKVRVTETLGKGAKAIPAGTEVEVQRVTPSMIWVEGWRIPQAFYQSGKIVKVGTLRSRVIRLAASLPPGSDLRQALVALTAAVKATRHTPAEMDAIGRDYVRAVRQAVQTVKPLASWMRGRGFLYWENDNEIFFMVDVPRNFRHTDEMDIDEDDAAFDRVMQPYDAWQEKLDAVQEEFSRKYPELRFSSSGDAFGPGLRQTRM